MDGNSTLNPDNIRFHIMEIDRGLHAIADFEDPTGGPELISNLKF